MAGFNRNDMRQFAGFTAENLKEKAQIFAGKSVVFAKNAADKAKLAGKLTVVNGNIAMEKQNLAAARQALGEKYFDYYGGYPADVLKGEVEAVKAAMAKLEALRREAEEIKSSEKAASPEAPAPEVQPDEDAPEIITDEDAGE